MIKVENDEVSFKGDVIDLLSDVSVILDKLSIKLNYNLDEMVIMLTKVIRTKRELAGGKNDINLS